MSVLVRKKLWVFPTLEWIHLYSMVCLVSVTGIVDLRLMGFTLQESHEPLRGFSRKLLRWAWLFLTLNVVTGLCLFASNAPTYFTNWAFRIKILLIATAVVDHYVFVPLAVRWQDSFEKPLGVKFVGALSLLLWLGVIGASRWIAFS